MAIVKTGHINTDKYLAFVAESTFQTPIADTAVFSKFHLLGNTVPAFVPVQFVDKPRLNRGKNMVSVSDAYMTENAQTQRYEIPEFICPINNLSQFLYGVCQNVSEGATTPFVKTYTMDGSVDPDFSSDAGFFFTLLIAQPIASESQKLTSCVFEKLTIKISPENGGRAVCSGTVISMSGHTMTANPTGANVYTSVAPPDFHNATSTLTIGSQDLVYEEMEFTIETDYDWIGYNAGNCENMKVVNQKVSFRAVAKYDSNSDILMRSKGTDIGALAFDIGTDAATGYLSLASPETWIDDVKEVDSEDEVNKLEISGDCLLSASSGPVIEAADAVDRSW